MVLLAFSLQDQVEKYGAYVGVASFFGLAVLSLLYFAQAREVRRLREWAGRAPERLLDYEARVATQPPAARAVHAPVRAVPIAQAAAPVAGAVAGNGGGHKLKPEQVAALAFARAAGVPSPPHPPTPSVPVANGAGAALAEPVAAAVAAPAAAPEPAEAGPPTPPPAEVPPAPLPNGGGNVPEPATPAARRVPAAPLRATPPPRRPAAPAPSAARRHTVPPRRESSTRTVVLTVVSGIAVLAVLGFAALKVLGGGDNPTTPANSPTKIATVGPSDGGGGGAAKPTPTPPAHESIAVVVLNGTTTSGLAAKIGGQLVLKGFTSANVGAGNADNLQTPTSSVLYKRGAKSRATEVAKTLGIKAATKPIDAASQADVSKAAALSGGAAKDPDVIVIVGNDKSQ
jgi:hypothetical protein